MNICCLRMEYVEDEDVRISGGYRTAPGPQGYSTAPGPSSYTTTAPINQSTKPGATTDVAFSNPPTPGEPVKGKTLLKIIRLFYRKKC